eukprot:6214293-Pleurochrysis_carterae.AAC.5
MSVSSFVRTSETLWYMLVGITDSFLNLFALGCHKRQEHSHTSSTQNSVHGVTGVDGRFDDPDALTQRTARSSPSSPATPRLDPPPERAQLSTRRAASVIPCPPKTSKDSSLSLSHEDAELLFPDAVHSASRLHRRLAAVLGHARPRELVAPLVRRWDEARRAAHHAPIHAACAAAAVAAAAVAAAVGHRLHAATLGCMHVAVDDERLSQHRGSHCAKTTRRLAKLSFSVLCAARGLGLAFGCCRELA